MMKVAFIFSNILLFYINLHIVVNELILPAGAPVTWQPMRPQANFSYGSYDMKEMTPYAYPQQFCYANKDNSKCAHYTVIVLTTTCL